MPDFYFRRGEDIVVHLDADFDIAEASDVRAFMLHPESKRRYQMQVTSRAAQGDIPNGWDFLYPAAEAAKLSNGKYLVDEIHSRAGLTDITDSSVEIEITEAASSSASLST
ncbi:MAG: hypothetical protein AAFY42_02890 [Pseudomonadota bacterium]